MTEKDEIKSYFQDLNIDVNEDVLNKCLELCIAYKINAEDFCDQWWAFTASNLNGAPPTLEYLEKMERKEFHKKEHSFSKIKYEHIQENSSRIKISNEFESAELTPQSKLKEKILTPAGKTPTLSVNSSEKFSQRTDSRSIQQYYGSTSAKFKRESIEKGSVKEVEEYRVPTTIRYMYEIMGKKAKSMNSLINELGHAILDNYGLNLSDGLLINQMGDMVTYGRIVSDSEGKINSQSILLEGSDESNLNYATRLNISKLSKYSLFPGQVVAVKGTNVKNHAFVAEKIFTDAHLDLPEEPPVQNSSIQIVVAAGPFTLHENLSYEPLHEFLNYVVENEPHVLILMGPFVDQNHKSVTTGDITQTFDSFFEDLIDTIMEKLQHLDIRIIIVPNQKEVHHHPIYPTPPYHIKEKYNNLTFVVDPGVFDIEGLRIVATTADILFHMSGYELHFDNESVIKSGRMERMISHILNQRCVYPLYPPHKDIYLDQILLKQYGQLNCKPHILILPSVLKNFVKDVGDCLVINPERLTTGFQAGTFARIEVEPGNTKSICGRVAVQVLRV